MGNDSLSTLLLTLLLCIGLFFFIRASVKDRTEVVTLVSSQPLAELRDRLERYFEQRTYRLVQPDLSGQSSSGQDLPAEVLPAGDDASGGASAVVTLEGFVQPSLFLAVFLSVLAAIGLSCLVLVALTVVPQLQGIGWLGLLLAPAAGFFYWRQAGRVERVCYQLQAVDPTQPQARVKVMAHRDEVISLQESLALKLADE